MNLGVRSIRSAGRTSGSIEITLPVRLQALEGIECRLMVRDGPRPEIVLQPDLSQARELVEILWRKLALGVEKIDDLGDFSPADFALVLFAPRHWQERPPLAYSDALFLLRSLEAKDGSGREELARILSSLAVVAGRRLGLESALCLAFGDAVAYLMTGVPAGLGTDFERGMAHRAFWGDRSPNQWPLGAFFDDEVWLRARSDLGRVYDGFRGWLENPQAYEAERRKWYRALTVESGVFFAQTYQSRGSYGET